MKRVGRSLICLMAGVYSITQFPTSLVANNTYMSENALQPSVAESTYSTTLYQEAAEMTQLYMKHIRSHEPDFGISRSDWIATWLTGRLKSIHLDHVYTHRFRTTQHMVSTLVHSA